MLSKTKPRCRDNLCVQSHKKILIDCLNVHCTFPFSAGAKEMVLRQLVRISCVKCGLAHPCGAEKDFDPPKYCAECSSERRANARRSLNISDGIRLSLDERYVLPEGYFSASSWK